MPRTINPIKQKIVENSLKQGKSARQALKDANYSAGAVSHSTHNSVVKRSMENILAEFDMAKITPDYVISNVESIMKDIKANHSDKLRACELLGRFLSIWRDNSTVNVNDITDKGKNLISKYFPVNRVGKLT